MHKELFKLWECERCSAHHPENDKHFCNLVFKMRSDAREYYKKKFEEGEGKGCVFIHPQPEYSPKSFDEYLVYRLGKDGVDKLESIAQEYAEHILKHKKDSAW